MIIDILGRVKKYLDDTRLDYSIKAYDDDDFEDDDNDNDDDEEDDDEY